MTYPGFTADRSLADPGRSYVRRRARGGGGGRGVSAQIRGGGGFGGSLGGGLFYSGSYWTCVDACQRAWSSCLDTCEGTWENPKPSRNCWLCDDAYNACVQRCTGPIA